MTAVSVPFAVQTYDLGCQRDGRAVTLAPMGDAAAIVLGTACAEMDPWKRYGIAAAHLTAAFAAREAGAFRYCVQVDGVMAGAMIVRSPWLIGPYLQFIAVLPAGQGAGVGGRLLTWFEAQARMARQRNIWLCVTGFNEPARAFYRSHGWADAATLPGLVADDVDEIMMRKRLTASRGH